MLVTGGAGFIGACLVARLLEAGHAVVVVDDLSSGSLSRLPAHPRLEFHQLDLGVPGQLGEALGHERRFGAIFHLAARVGVRSVLRDPEGCRQANLAAVDEVLAYVQELGAGRRGRLFAASTSEVYAECCAPLSEDHPLRPVHGVGRWAYAGSKVLAEQRIEARRELWSRGEAPVHLRFFNVVGPGQDSVGGMVLPSFIERARAGQPLLVHGRGEELRTFAHVEEVSQLLLQLFESGSAPGGALNIGGVAKCRIRDLARVVLEEVPGGGGIEYIDPRQDCGSGFEGIRHREPDLGRLRRLGLPLPSSDLRSIVRDCALHHPRQGEALGSSLESGYAWPCASPAY